MAIKAYSYAKDGNRKLSANFAVKEFRCKDGSDPIFIDDELVTLLQKIRDHFGKSVKAGRPAGWVHIDTRAAKSRWVS